MNIGIISDTHKLLRPEVFEIFRDVDHILHAGDIGSKTVLTQLETIAPVTAIRGNVDQQPWAQQYPETCSIRLAGKSIYLIHSLKWLNIDPAKSGYDIIISGHSHIPLIEKYDQVLCINPGSAGPRRFNLPVSIALLKITHTNASPKIINLSI